MRSLNTGFEEMCSLMGDFDFDAFGVTETWLHPDTPSENYKIPGYVMIRSDRHTTSDKDNRQKQTGGGVALYLKAEIRHEQRHLSREIDPGIEYVCVVIKSKGVKLGLCVVYRPSYIRYSRLEELFHSLFVDLAVEVNHVMYIGDTNIDMQSNNSPASKYLYRLLKENNAVQVIKEPTRVTENSTSLLDHIILDKAAVIKRSGVIDVSRIKDYRSVNISDHKLIFCDLVHEKEKNNPKMIIYRDFSNFNPDLAAARMSEVSWEEACTMTNVNEVEQYITSHIKNVFDELAPVVCKRVTKKRAPWRNDQIKYFTSLKNQLKKVYSATGKDRDWKNYARVRNRLNGLIRKTKKDFFARNITENTSTKDFWNCLKKGDIVKKCKDAAILPDIRAEDVNRYFADMGGNGIIDDELLSFYKSSTLKENEEEKFKFVRVSEDEVVSAMNSIKSDAVGCDQISIKMIKAASPYALKSITHLVNLSLSKNIFPNNWKMSIIHPIPKVTSPTCAQNLRPISLLPAMSKIVEKIVIQQINRFINEEKILPKLQSGFRQNYSTCTALVNLFEDLFRAKDQGKYSSLVLLDYSQAFDSINHELLIAKMNYYGFGTNVQHWMKSYLEERLQVTKFGSETSGPLSKLRGVPQGSCLGPILFNLYTADLPSCVRDCTPHLYADDCQLHLSYDREMTIAAIMQINSDLVSIADWSEKNGLKLNVGKCTVLHTGSQALIQSLGERDVGVELGGERLTVSNSVKTLGVVLDSDLSFTEHVTFSVQRALGRLKGLHRHRTLLPECAKLQIMQSMVLSVVNYCYPAYGNSISKEDIGRIQRLQNSAIRFIFNLNRFDHVSFFRNAANFLPMQDVCRVMTCCLVHKVLLLGEPLYLSERLCHRDDVSERSTRHGRMLHFPKVRLEVGRRGFAYFAPTMYNGLPDDLKQIKSAIGFKLALKNVFFQQSIE